MPPIASAPTILDLDENHLCDNFEVVAHGVGALLLFVHQVGQTHGLALLTGPQESAASVAHGARVARADTIFSGDHGQAAASLLHGEGLARVFAAFAEGVPEELQSALCLNGVALDDVLQHVLVALNEGLAVEFPVVQLLVAIPLNALQQGLHLAD